LFPFNLLNYAFGMTRVSAKDYVFASALGMLPGTFLYVYLGASAGNLVSLGHRNETDTASHLLIAIGLLITFVLTVYLHRLAQGQLERERLGCMVDHAAMGRTSPAST